MIASDFFLRALADNSASISMKAESILLASVEGHSVVPCSSLEVEEFAQLGRCQILPSSTPRPEYTLRWGGEDYDQLYPRYRQIVWKVEWEQQTLTVVQLNWDTSCGSDGRNWVIAENNEIAKSFILEVERATHTPQNAILTFASGHWSRNHNLYQATQAASFEDLVLADDLKKTIRSDFRQFLDSEDRYQQMGITWRRGALMIGPPGNGKTHCIRALLKELDISTLYVQSLSHRFHTEEQMWQVVFERARGLRPCVLVLEDLDSLVNEDNRSFFLNQLDGFERNHGMIVLATTNYPERIDSAIIDRPSRFDRKYHFDLPGSKERRQYLSNWRSQLSDETRWTDEQLDHVASVTDGFSFAYLKELVISSVMNWMHDTTASFGTVMEEQAKNLRKQMATETSN